MIDWFFQVGAYPSAFFSALYMFFMTVLGAMLVFFGGRTDKRFFTALTGIAAGIMISSAAFSLLLPALENCNTLLDYLLPVFAFCFGGGVIVLCDVLPSLFRTVWRKKRCGDSPSLGDGTAVSDRSDPIAEKQRKNRLFCLAVAVHNIPEGLAVGIAFGVAAALGDKTAFVSALVLAFGVGLQNFPEGLCVAFPLRAQGYSRRKAFLLSSLCGSIEIFACMLGAFIVSAAQSVLTFSLSFAAGAMIAVTCSELIPECFARFKNTATLGLVFGFALMMFLDVAFG